MRLCCRTLCVAAVTLVCSTLSNTVGSGHAAENAVDLELVLAVDVSLSMDLDELRLQRRGYVAAFRHPEVIAAITSGRLGRIAVTYLEWGGAGTGRMMLPWTVIDGMPAAERFASSLATARINRFHRTSISDILVKAGALFDGNGFTGTRRVIDVSGDGPNNQGPSVTSARDAVIRRGITINGLPILLKAAERPAWFDVATLDRYYKDCVIGGEGAFIVRVRSPGEFAAAIRRKLVLEIAGIQAGVRLAQLRWPSPATDCLIGERLWNSRHGSPRLPQSSAPGRSTGLEPGNAMRRERRG